MIFQEIDYLVQIYYFSFENISNPERVDYLRWNYDFFHSKITLFHESQLFASKIWFSIKEYDFPQEN